MYNVSVRDVVVITVIQASEKIPRPQFPTEQLVFHTLTNKFFSGVFTNTNNKPLKVFYCEKPF
jgi:hypothetical protein